MEKGKENRGTKKVLVVDDEPVMRDVLKELLGSRGYYTCLASNGIEALEHLDEEKFDLVITDLRMPKMGGIELFDEMERRGINTPVLIVTGTPDEMWRCEKKERCFAGFLTKPFDLHDFYSKVTAACGASQVMKTG